MDVDEYRGVVCILGDLKEEEEAEEGAFKLRIFSHSVRQIPFNLRQT